ncbi:MAG TPA: hypothetical protein VGB51_02535 [Actinomycetota bacterium]
MRGKGKRTLLSGGVLLVVAALVGVGTLASFTAQTRNPSNVLANGTLVMSNKVGTGTACLSTSGGSTDSNVNNACDVAINRTVQKPGDSYTADLTIKNEGSLAASALTLFMAACANGDAAGESYNGTGLPCGKVQLYVQEMDSGFAANVSCKYGGGTATDCDFSDAAKTLGAYQTAYNSSASGLGLGATAAGASKYYRIGVKLPSDADNTYQGRSATFDLTWYMEQ